MDHLAIQFPWLYNPDGSLKEYSGNQAPQLSGATTFDKILNAATVAGGIASNIFAAKNQPDVVYNIQQPIGFNGSGVKNQEKPNREDKKGIPWWVIAAGIIVLIVLAIIIF